MRNILVICIICYFATTYSQTPTNDKNWNPVFIDDFNTINSILWNIPDKVFHGEKEYMEPQIYLRQNVHLNDNGVLTIEVKKEDYYCNDCNRYYSRYTSGEIMSNKTYQYGHFEMTCKLPKGRGFWSAFWLWNDRNTVPCWYNEIDIFEMNGRNPYMTTNNVHWNYDCPRIEGANLNDIFEEQNCKDYSLDYHKYSLEWDPENITWYLDDKMIRTEKNTYGIDYSLYLIVNLAIFPQDLPDNATVFPASISIDRISVHRLKMDYNAVVNKIDNFHTFNYAVKKSIVLDNQTLIPKNLKFTLRATDYIELKNEFEVPLGTEATFIITPSY